MVDLLSGIQSTAAALNAERTRMDVISENLANVQTKGYQRKVVVFETALQQALDGTGQVSTLHGARIQSDTRPALRVFQPGHPDADAQGFVTLPNVNIHEEMADLIAASRTFEANLAVVRNARTMALQTLAIGKK
jgi:flagellar basal-body rod protein FlgC